jgi:hypothetical protein
VSSSGHCYEPLSEVIVLAMRTWSHYSSLASWPALDWQIRKGSRLYRVMLSSAKSFAIENRSRNDSYEQKQGVEAGFRHSTSIRLE